VSIHSRHALFRALTKISKMISNQLTNKRVLLGVTGGIAAYKSAEICRRLQDEGAEVRTAMTAAAQEFITPLTLQALSKNPVHLDLLDPETESAMGHIELARWADLILIAPASANFISRLAQGRGDDLLTAICLAADCKVAIAPAMNRSMWEKEVTQKNLAQTKSVGISVFAPGEGEQACGETGVGRLLDVPDIILLACELFETGVLSGKKVVVTAGPTREAIDPIRYISNHSSGKQGYAIAEAAAEAGANVVLISGPTNLPKPDRAQLIKVESAGQMLDAVLDQVPGTDVFISVAAVADFKTKLTAPNKIKKNVNGNLTIELSRTPDILSEVTKIKGNHLFTVGFAAETENLLENANSKLKEKKLDMIVANDVSDSEIGFNSDLNEATVLTPKTSINLPKANKTQLARNLIEIISEQLAGFGTDARARS